MKLPLSGATFLRRHTLWVGLIAVLAPLAVLLCLQYSWLVTLEHNSAKVQEATLKNYLEAVVDKVEWRYRNDAERVLNVGNYVFLNDRLDKAAYHFKKKGVTGVKRLFVASFVHDNHGKVLYFEPSCSSFTPAEASEEARAIYVAYSPLLTLAHKGGVLSEPVQVFVDHRAPEYPMILNPITDDASRVVGVAGMILDEDYFRNEVLPEAIKESLPAFFSSRDKPVVAVWDGKGDMAFRTARLSGPAEAQKHFSFVFTNWRVGLDSRHATAGQVAKRNFGVNLGLSALLAAVLLGGIVLALRTASREMKLSEMKNDFVSNVSHELRTPLASIRVFGELLRLGRVENQDKVREYGEYIETESRRLTQLINNLLDFASIESGRKSYKFERVDVSELVSETLKTFGVRLRQHGFRVVFDGPSGSLPPVRVDPGAIAQSLSNLLDNAVKYSYQTENKEIRVGLRREGDSVAISVQDHGIGIPRSEQKKIFDRFHRVGTGLVHDVKGSGLGLSIVQHIVQAHGGQVTVESRSGEGSTFSILLPIETAGAAGMATAPETRRPSEA
ncbi:MAG: two-component system, OmpR family, phosphate regulon sensor histidine kinase PhoR [Acidobacteriota bacterium]|jgi:signal transduction histidine kinase|nr:two-component system, OmpR family, phosphate regulon sensor histidine kinase PhoR [Acidobacteriota bacterium]